MIEIKDGSIKYGDRVLFMGLSFMVNNGEARAFCVPHGLGKTSLMRAFVGLQPLAEGFVSIDGEPLLPSDVRLFRRFMSYIPQNMEFPLCRQVSDFVKTLFLLRVNEGVEYSKRLLMDEWDVLLLDRELYDKAVSDLSVGQLRRVMMSVAGLLHKPIVVIDEPFMCQDEASSPAIAEWLCRVASDGSSVLVASSDAAEWDMDKIDIDGQVFGFNEKNSSLCSLKEQSVDIKEQ